MNQYFHPLNFNPMSLFLKIGFLNRNKYRIKTTIAGIYIEYLATGNLSSPPLINAIIPSP
jgi:hypothetical protein